MSIRVEVRSQAEFDACVKIGNLAIVINCSVVARENSSVVAWDNSSVEAWDNSSVEAWGNSSVEAWGNSSVVAWGLTFIRWFSCLKIKASLQVIIAKVGDAKGKQSGGRVLPCKLPQTANEWCEFYGVEVTEGIAILFKAVDDDYSTSYARQRNIFYAPGNMPTAPDWDGGKQECGGGLHFSPALQMALSFNSNAKKFVACPVKLEDIVVHPNGQYPEKVKAKGCCAPVWEVNRKGERL
jgi:hypothetical protein